MDHTFGHALCKIWKRFPEWRINYIRGVQKYNSGGISLHHFPNERAKTSEVSKKLASHLYLADQVQHYWMHLPFDKLLSSNRETLSTVMLSMTLDTQAVRKFRTAIDLCRRGEGADASTIARSQFETAVATAWVLFPVVRLEVIKRIDKRTGADLLHGDGKPRYAVKVPTRNNRLASHRLTRHQRASILAAACEVQDENFVRSRHSVPGRKRAAKQIAKSQDATSSQIIENIVGPEWYSILQQSPHTYSGLSFRNLCSLLGKRLDYWYDLVYPFQSRDTHSVNVLQYSESSESNNLTRSWYTPNGMLSGTLSTSITSFLTHAEILSNYLLKDDSVSQQIRKFTKLLTNLDV